jgi:hypothetical protein
MTALLTELSVAADDMFSPRRMASWMIRFMEPPYKMKVPTLKPMKPGSASTASQQKIISGLEETNRNILATIESMKAEKLNPDSAKGAHPLFSFIKMTLTEMLLLI